MNMTKERAYRVFTTRFDCEVAADRLDSVLGSLSPEDEELLAGAWSEFKSDLGNRTTEIDVLIADVTSRIRMAVSDADLSDTVVTLLLDQSGSMKGRSMQLAAAAISSAQEFLGQMNVRTEVLGFTTASWHGGRARRRWKWRLKPRRPGRLCDLLHIIYGDADDVTPSLSERAIRSMLRPDLPKENIDGEAIQWAAQRLEKRAEKRKILVVLSDGSPVDDSTHRENGPMYLDRHLQDVIADLQSGGIIELAALGIGYDVSGWYARSSTLGSADDTASSLVHLLEDLLTDRPQ